MLTFATGPHGANNAAPRIHDTLPERDDIVVHLIGAVAAGRYGSSLLKNLRNNREVGLKVPANGTSNVAKALKNGWLELVGKSRAL